MAERIKSALVEAMNSEMGKTLEQWKYYPESMEGMAILDTLFRLAGKMKLEMILEVRKDSIQRNDDFIRILPRDAEILGKETENSWIFPIPPKVENRSNDPYVLNATNASGEPRLIYYHMYHGTVAVFRPSDIVSIALQ